jgi:hypothetical protein
LIFIEDVIPYGDEFLKRDGEVKEVFQRLKELRRGYLPDFVAIHRAFFKVKKIGKYPLGILEFFLLSESGEFLRNLVMAERENDIA